MMKKEEICIINGKIERKEKSLIYEEKFIKDFNNFFLFTYGEL